MGVKINIVPEKTTTRSATKGSTTLAPLLLLPKIHDPENTVVGSPLNSKDATSNIDGSSSSRYDI